MKRKLTAALLCAALLLTLAGCGKAPSGGETRAEPSQEPSQTQTAAPPEPEVPEKGTSVPLSFPLLAAPFSDAQTEAMVNHNARRCALTIEDRYYSGCLYDDGSRALVRYEIIDNGLYHRTSLVPDCAAEFLCESGGRLYYLGASGMPESIKGDGTERRTELDAPCRSLQFFNGMLYCLTEDGTLLGLRGGEKEALLGGCSWAWVWEKGVLYTDAADGRAHFYAFGVRTDVTLTAAAAETPTVIGSALYYTVSEPDGKHLCSLDLISGETQRQETPFDGEADYLRDRSGDWAVRLTGLGGEAGQQIVSCAAAFAAPLRAQRTEEGYLRRCRGQDDILRTDELFSPDGTPLGFALVLPDGSGALCLAADIPAGK